MAQARLPPGFRFHPTDEELVSYYLKRKVMGKPLRFTAVSEVELYKFAPWDLPDQSCFRTKDREWYFFCPRDKKYPKGLRANRSTEIGYWKTTGKDRNILHGSCVVGMKKSLIFHTGKPPKGDRTDWVMYEYRLTDDRLAASGVAQDAFVLCKIFEKSGMGPKIGEQYGALFNEEDWEDDSDLEAAVAAFPFLPCQQPAVHSSNDISATTSIPEHIPRTVPATIITEELVLTPVSTTIAESVPASVAANTLLEHLPLSEFTVPIHSSATPLAAESVALHSAVIGAGGYNELLPEITGPPLGTPQCSAAIPSTPDMDGIDLMDLIIDAPYYPGNDFWQLADLQPPPAVVNYNEAARDETNGIYGELADLVDGSLNVGDEVDQLNGAMTSDNTMAQPLLPELGDEHYLELNDILCDQGINFFSDFYDPVWSPEMDIDAIFSQGDGHS